MATLNLRQVCHLPRWLHPVRQQMSEETHQPRRSPNEWDKLAKWVINNKLVSHNVRWLIQVPRLYEVFKGGGLINNFEEVVKSTSLACMPHWTLYLT